MFVPMFIALALLVWSLPYSPVCKVRGFLQDEVRTMTTTPPASAPTAPDPNFNPDDPSHSPALEDEHQIPVPPVEAATDAAFPLGRGGDPETSFVDDPLEHLREVVPQAQQEAATPGEGLPGNMPGTTGVALENPAPASARRLFKKS